MLRTALRPARVASAANTPLQALTLLNDEACFEAARALATRVLAVGKDQTTDARIRYAFRLGSPASRMAKSEPAWRNCWPTNWPNRP